MRVWLENWEWQCCGEPFGLGSEVVWGLAPVDDCFRSSLAAPLGADLARTITHYETHHWEDEDEKPTDTRGRVDSIHAVYWHVASRPGEDARFVYPVAGTGFLETRERVELHAFESEEEPDIESALSFAGYIVDFDPLD